jgi:hypothetical protein
MSAGGKRTVCPSVLELAMPPANSKNCVERRNGVGNGGGFDEVFLGDLRAEKAAGKQPFSADDRKHDVMTDTPDGFRRKEIAGGTLEEFQHGFVVPRRRVRNINDDLCASQRRRQSLPSDLIDAPRRGRGHDFVILLTEVVNEFSADQTRAADDDDFHGFVFSFRDLVFHQH